MKQNKYATAPMFEKKRLRMVCVVIKARKTSPHSWKTPGTIILVETLSSQIWNCDRFIDKNSGRRASWIHSEGVVSGMPTVLTGDKKGQWVGDGKIESRACDRHYHPPNIPRMFSANIGFLLCSFVYRERWVTIKNKDANYNVDRFEI